MSVKGFYECGILIYILINADKTFYRITFSFVDDNAHLTNINFILLWMNKEVHVL